MLAKNMWVIKISCVIVSLLAINHLVNGIGCWGYQAGGRFSAILYVLQLVTAAAAALLAIEVLIGSRHQKWKREILVVGFLMTAIMVSLKFLGIRMMTSAHHQGAENLVPFVIATVGSIMLGKVYDKAVCFRDYSHLNGFAQGGADEPTTVSQLEWKPNDNPNPESEVRPQ